MDASKKLWLDIFARKRFLKLNSSLLRRSLAGLGVNDYGPRQQAAEKWLLEAMLKKLPKSAVVFDVGAHTGAYASFLAERRDDIIIHAFEPNPVVYKKLEANASGRYQAHEFALGEKNGVSLLHDPKSDGGSECASLVGEAVDGPLSRRRKAHGPCFG